MCQELAGTSERHLSIAIVRFLRSAREEVSDNLELFLVPFWKLCIQRRLHIELLCTARRIRDRHMHWVAFCRPTAFDITLPRFIRLLHLSSAPPFNCGLSGPIARFQGVVHQCSRDGLGHACVMHVDAANGVGWHSLEQHVSGRSSNVQVASERDTNRQIPRRKERRNVIFHAVLSDVVVGESDSGDRIKGLHDRIDHSRQILVANFEAV
mmetsp:Transcript_108496/g.305794  ORF Transcript_108496/g.305794 Transcript_108496/m.305794 type:complete len:210 (+) Transcript_108496:642-1271(+)